MQTKNFRRLSIAFALVLGAVLLAAPAAAKSCNIDAGPIWNQQDADKKCPGVCSKVDGDWTGQWWTTVPGEMSVCQCSVCEPCKSKNENAGPIWNQQDADKKCPEVCQKNNGSWNGQWWTTEPGKMSVCQCVECP